MGEGIPNRPRGRCGLRLVRGGWPGDIGRGRALHLRGRRTAVGHHAGAEHARHASRDRRRAGIPASDQDPRPARLAEEEGGQRPDRRLLLGGGCRPGGPGHDRGAAAAARRPRGPAASEREDPGELPRLRAAHGALSPGALRLRAARPAGDRRLDARGRPPRPGDGALAPALYPQPAGGGGACGELLSRRLRRREGGAGPGAGGGICRPRHRSRSRDPADLRLPRPALVAGDAHPREPEPYRREGDHRQRPQPLVRCAILPPRSRSF